MYGLHDQVGKKVGILGYGSIGRQSMLLTASMKRLLTVVQSPVSLSL